MTQDTNYFKTFCRISKAFGTTLNTDELLDLIVRSAIDTMAAKAACLFLADEERGLSVPVAQKGLSEGYLHAEPMRIETAVKEILAAGGYLAFRDAASDPRLDNHEAKQAEGIASILAVPITMEGKGVGVLSLYTAEPRDFSEDEVDFLTALAEQGGITIQHARLFERLDKNSRLFYSFSSSINSSRDVRKIFHILSADIGETFGMKGVSIRLFNPETRMMDLVASYGLSETFINKGPISADKSEVVAEILRDQTVIIEDVTTDPRLQYPEESKAEGIVSVLGVPVKSRDQVIGELRLYSGVQRDFPENLVNLIIALAHQGGIAIENARLVDRIRMNTEIFHDMAVSMNETLDVKKILHVLSADIAEIFDVKAVSIRLLDEDQKTLELVASYGLSETYLNKGPVYAEASISEALQKKVSAVLDASTDEGVQYRDEKRNEGIVSILSIPIHARDDVIGVMRLYSGVKREFTEDDIMLAVALAHQGGLAIQNASMYLSLQEDKQDLEQDIWSHRSWF